MRAEALSFIRSANMEQVSVKSTPVGFKATPIIVITVGNEGEQPDDHVDFVTEVYDELKDVLKVPFIVCSDAIHVHFMDEY